MKSATRSSRGRGLVVVSNRQPYAHRRDAGAVRVEVPAGGLTSAMDLVLRGTGGTWVAWGHGSADREVVDGSGCVAVPPEHPLYTLKRVWLEDDLVENYYHGYANQVLWPLCHMAMDRVIYLKRFWSAYQQANRRFADAVLEVPRAGAVWFHDYHLCLAPAMVRQARPGLRTGLFWHIPWPDWSVFRACPQAREVLEGLLGNDLLGFQIPLFVRNFIDCVRECLQARVDYVHSRVTYRGHTTRIESYPISIDAEGFRRMAEADRTVRLMARLKRRWGLEGRKIGVGVDRLEYTKGLLKRLQAIDLLFERYASLRGNFTYIQIAVPTRMKEPYLSYRAAVEALVARINRRHGRPDWDPVVFIDTKVEHRDLVAYYRMADVGIVSSIYDGMNLVAKEFAASQTDGRGVLVLSEMAGAADELEGALLVNPYDTEGFAGTIRRALRMDPGERRERMAALQRQVGEHDIRRWVHDILADLVGPAPAATAPGQSLADGWSPLEAALDGRPVGLMLDYDGTLSPIVKDPARAHLPEANRALLLALAERMPVAIVSGRSLDDLRGRIGIDALFYVGNHGSEIAQGDRVLHRQDLSASRPVLEECLQRVREALIGIPGAIVEDKGGTASVHYRMVRARDLEPLFARFTRVLEEYEGVFRVTAGKKVLEIRPKGLWNKGRASLWLARRWGRERAPLYVGDDVTDVDAFRALKERGVSIAVGPCPDADFTLPGTTDVTALLRWLARRAEPAVRRPSRRR